jgi:hypothetical protein
VLNLLHDPHARRPARDQRETSEVAWVAPDRLDSLNIHPSMRLRIDHYLERRSAPYIG